MSKLFNIGDSFAVGNCIDSFNHLSDKHLSPGALLANHFGLEEVNLARTGNSFDGILKDLYISDFSDCSFVSICTPPASRVYARCKAYRPIDKNRDGRLHRLLKKLPDLSLSTEMANAIKYAYSKVNRPAD